MHKILDAKRILVINLGGIGDTLLSIPALRLLRASYKKAIISLLTIPRSIDVLTDFGYIDNIILFKPGLQNKISLSLTLIRSRFDMVINMRPLTSFLSSLKVAFLFLLTDARYRIGRDTGGRAFFLNVKIPEKEALTMHEIDRYLSILEALGLKAEDKSIEINVNYIDTQYIRNFLFENGVKEDDILVGINPGAARPSRQWPLENFTELITLLLKEKKVKIVITGTKQEAGLAEELQRLCKVNLINAAGRTNFGQLAALIKICNLYIANDTGPIHLAAALNTPLIALFGSGGIIGYDPRRLWDKAIVFYNKTSCSPCIKFKCDSMKCLKSINPEEVKEAALRLL